MKHLFWAIALFTLFLASTFAQSRGYWYAYAPQQVFTTQERPYITISGSGTQRLQVQVHQADLKKIDFHHLSSVNPSALKGKPVGQPITVQFAPPSPKRSYHATDVRLPQLPAGIYVVSVSSATQNVGLLIWISDHGLVIKLDPDGRLIARVVNLQTGAGINGATVALYTKSKAADAEATTNADGLAQLPCPQVYDSAMVWATKGPHRAAAYLPPRRALESTLTYLFTDRPVYRPGQKVYFKGIVRERVENDFRPLKASAVRVTVLAPDGNNLLEMTLPVSERGTFEGEVPLTDETPLGGYSFNVLYLEGEEAIIAASHVGGFEVQEYRKPEFRVKLEPAQKLYIRGETVTFRLSADYYFGAPVAGARVRYYLYKRFAWWPRWTKPVDDFAELYDDEDESSNEFADGYGELLERGEVTTDRSGRAIIQTKARAFAQPVSYALEVEVSDLSLRTEEAAASVPVYPSTVLLDWDAEQYWLEPKQTGRYRIYTGYLRTERPVSTAVKVSAYRVQWRHLKTNRWQRKETLLWSRIVRTGADGYGNVDFVPPTEGDFVLRGAVTDAQGRTVQNETWVYVFSSHYRGDEAPARHSIELMLDKKSYLPGERAKILIRSSIPNAQVWLTIEGRKLFSSTVVALRSGVGVTELPIDWQYVPNAFVSASIVNRKTHIRVQKLLRVTAVGKLLQVEVVPHKERYLPDEEAVYTIRTRDTEGKPIPAEVALGVVDEAIYAILPDYTPDIRKFFWGATPNAVNTSVSFGREYAAGAAKEVGFHRLEPDDARIRRRFEDTAFWSASIFTDENGEAQVRFTMPENLTQWRATARAVNIETAVGMTRSYARTFKPLLVRLGVPRFLTQQDRSVITGIVHNYTDKPQDVLISLQVAGQARIVTGLNKRVTLPPQGQTSLEWTVEAATEGTATFRLTARSQEEFDGMELSIPVYARGVPRMFAGASVVQTALEKPFRVPSQRVAGSTKMVVRVAPSWFGTAVGALDELITYPYGCIEQTVHPLLAALSVLEAGKALGIEDPQRRAKLDDIIQKGVARVLKMQSPNGDWGYTEHVSGELMWTSLAVEALYRAQQAGYSVPPERLQRGLQALYRHASKVSSQPPNLKALPQNKRRETMMEWVDNLNAKAHALATAAAVSPDWARKPLLRLYESRQHLFTSSECALSMALHDVKLQAQASRMQNEILARAIATPTTAFWKEKKPQLLYSTPWSWYGQDTYSSAWVARMLAKLEPSHPMLHKALRWLASKRQGGYWYSTNDSAQIIMALTQYAQRKPGAARGVHRVRVLLNGELIKELEYRAEDWFRSEDVIPVPSDRLRKDINTLRLEHEGEGEVVASFMLRYFEPTEVVKPVSQQLRVERTYLKRVPRKLTPSERERLRQRYGDTSEYLWQLQPAKGVIRPGDQLLVKLVVHCATDIHYAVIDDPKPSGFEFLEEEEDRYGWIYWYSRREVRDDRTSFLGTYLPKGKSVITYRLRAERPGIVRARPTQAFGMYLPEVNGSSNENNVQVLKQ